MSLKSGTQEPYLSRSPAWPELKEQEANERGSIIHRIPAESDPQPIGAPGHFCVAAIALALSSVI